MNIVFGFFVFNSICEHRLNVFVNIFRPPKSKKIDPPNRQLSQKCDQFSYRGFLEIFGGPVKPKIPKQLQKSSMLEPSWEAPLCGPASCIFGHPGSALKWETLKSSTNVAAAIAAATIFDDFKTLHLWKPPGTHF